MMIPTDADIAHAVIRSFSKPYKVEFGIYG